MNRTFNLDAAHPSWHPCIQQGLQQMDPAYLDALQKNTTWLPGPQHIFSAFSLPVHQTHFILMGESPYPRAHSANGYAFWDAAVSSLWCDTGLDKTVNRATSLRNFVKMLLVAEGLLPADHLTQGDIARLDKTRLIQTSSALFKNLLQNGFLLLNATLVLRPGRVREDAKAWLPFIQTVLNFLAEQSSKPQLILFGKVAALLEPVNPGLPVFTAEHPYNLSFISNPAVQDFFRPLSLLRPTPATIKVSC